MSVLGLLGVAAGTAVAGPAGGATAGALPGILSNLFGGAGRDAQRKARADWFTAQGVQGSVTAARVVLGGLANTASHEQPFYQEGVKTITAEAPGVMNLALAAGPYWDTTDNDSSDHMRALVNNELATLGLTATAAPGVHTLPLMTTTASAGSSSAGVSPFLLAGAALLVVLLIVFAVRKS